VRRQHSRVAVTEHAELAHDDSGRPDRSTQPRRSPSPTRESSCCQARALAKRRAGFGVGVDTWACSFRSSLGRCR